MLPVFFLFFFELFYYSCLSFPPLLSPAPPTPCSHSQSPPCCPCLWVICTCSLNRPFPFFPPLSPSTLPSGPCRSVPCFHATGSILLICLFCSLGSCTRCDHMVDKCYLYIYIYGYTYIYLHINTFIILIFICEYR